jgi:hypothetical protein
MATHDVPGSNPDNHDKLHAGCWAEHEDGSLIKVDSTEDNRVIFEMFDMGVDPIMSYRETMPLFNFEREFSFNKNPGKTKEKWLWHDKTVFPWDKVIKKGFKDGPRVASAQEHRSAAARVAESLKLKGQQVEQENLRHRAEDVQDAKDTIGVITDKVARALRELMR